MSAWGKANNVKNDDIVRPIPSHLIRDVLAWNRLSGRPIFSEQQKLITHSAALPVGRGYHVFEEV